MIHQGRVEGRRAVITGGASGIGLGVATRLIAGHTLALDDMLASVVITVRAADGRRVGPRQRGLRPSASGLAGSSRSIGQRFGPHPQETACVSSRP